MFSVPPRFLSKMKKLQHCMYLCCVGWASSLHADELKLANADEYVFDPSMFRGSNINQNKMLKLSQQDILAGRYKVDIFLNRQLVEKTEIEFIEQNQSISACIRPEQAESWGIILRQDFDRSSAACHALNQLAGAGELRFDHSKMRVDIDMPQTQIKQQPRGYVAPELWDSGETVAFVNYSANYYHNEQQNSVSNQSNDNAYVALNGGFNLGKWQFRQQSNLQYQNGQTDFTVLRSYLKRPLPAISSELSLGELNSTGRLFSGVHYKGINLKSDERMLPDSQRGYAPIIQGIAQTMARVSVMQNGREIYQTTVAAGPFKITDLYPTSYNGDLQVTIYEANGQESQFSVPFSAMPESVRAGQLKYNLDVGQTQDTGQESPFVTFSSQYGLNNTFTLNSGLRIADDYQAAMFGTAFNHRLGAFGADMTYSRAGFTNGAEAGWMLGLSYSKAFTATNTNFAVAGYHFSTEGYRDLNDVLQIRDNHTSGTPSTDYTGSQRSRFTASINQNMGKYGMLSLSGSAQSYYAQREDDYQLQLGYGKTFQNGTSLNMNVARQSYRSTTNENSATKETSDTTVGLALTFPLAKNKTRVQDISLSYQNSQNSNSYQAQLAGEIDKAQTMHYNIGVHHDDSTQHTALNTNLQKRWNNMNTNIAAAISKDSWQVSGSAQGAVVLHSGGLTFGSYLGDTFAIVEAPGAEGAKIANSQNTKINAKGYALVPALTPYRYNSIALNPEGMSNDVDLDQGEHKVVPYAGATLKVKFDTRQGQATLLQAKMLDDSHLPLGADVLDEQQRHIAVVGQNSQIYFRAEQPQGQLNIIWGEESNERCRLSYNLADAETSTHFLKLTTICQSGE